MYNKQEIRAYINVIIYKIYVATSDINKSVVQIKYINVYFIWLFWLSHAVISANYIYYVGVYMLH